MGLETALFIGLTAFKAVSTMKNAKDQAKAITKQAELDAAARVEEGNIASKEKAKQIRYAAARQTQSFLSSGLTLDGTPSTVIGDTYTTGIEDLDLLKKNYDTSATNMITSANSKSKQIINQSRSEAISGIVDSFSGFSMGGNTSFTVPFTGSSSYVNSSGIPVPGNKPTRVTL